MRNSRVGAAFVVAVGLAACTAEGTQAAGDAPQASAAEPVSTGQSTMNDSVSVPDIAKVAGGSKDHSTLVAALKAANLVDVMATPGPFTVFAPTNAAFDALPTGTVESLLKPENKDKLTEILQHHVTTSALDLETLADGQQLSMVSAGGETITRKDGATFIGKGRIIGSVRASNGWVHVIDAVLVPAAP
jgi:uncharacterized surface protein with fasciclin (FAS1) repeats